MTGRTRVRPIAAPDMAHTPPRHCHDQGAAHTPALRAAQAPRLPRGLQRSWRTAGFGQHRPGRRCCPAQGHCAAERVHRDGSGSRPFFDRYGSRADRARHCGRTTAKAASASAELRWKQPHGYPYPPPVRQSLLPGRLSRATRAPSSVPEVMRRCRRLAPLHRQSHEPPQRWLSFRNSQVIRVASGPFGSVNGRPDWLPLQAWPMPCTT